MGLGSTEQSVLSFQPPRGDWAMRMRFWDEITRDYEKSVKLSLVIFYSRHLLRRAPFTPKPGHIAQSPRSARKPVLEVSLANPATADPYQTSTKSPAQQGDSAM